MDPDLNAVRAIAGECWGNPIGTSHDRVDIAAKLNRRRPGNICPEKRTFTGGGISECSGERAVVLP